MRTILVVAALAACAAGLTAQEAKKYEKEGKFIAKFPSGPEQITNTAGGLTVRVFLSGATSGKGVFLVTYSDLPVENLKAPKPEQVLESSEKGLVENFKAKVTKSGAVPFGPKKYAAREIIAERDDRHLRLTIVLAGNRLYQVYALGSKEFTTSEEANAFFSSFAITD